MFNNCRNGDTNPSDTLHNGNGKNSEPSAGRQETDAAHQRFREKEEVSFVDDEGHWSKTRKLIALRRAVIISPMLSQPCIA